MTERGDEQATLMMSPEQHPDEPAHTPSGDAPAPTHTHASTSTETSTEVDASTAVAVETTSEGAHAPGAGDAADAEGDTDDAEDGEGESGGEAKPAGEQAGAAAGVPGKKKRRRRRKKKPGGEAGVSADGAVHEHAEGVPEVLPDGTVINPEKPKRRDRPAREPRERPAFGYGDVVFGKILEITDDALLVDLSGKAKAIFDRRELDLPDDLDYGADGEDFDDEPAPAAPAADGAPAEVTPAADADAAPTEATSEAKAEEPAVAPVAEAAEAAPAAEETPVAEAKPEEPAPAEPKKDAVDFPIVKLEVGADFISMVHNDGGRGGLVVLTRHPKRMQRAKLVVGGAFKEKGEILGLVTGVIKGGVEVDVDGLRAFAPGSHMDLRLGVDLHPVIGKRLLFVVTQYAKRGKDVVLSRKPFLEAEARAMREEALKHLKIGEIVEGTVRSVVPFGAFIDVGGVEGLVPLSEMSHNRGDGPHDVFKAGEKTEVKILKVDERGKVWLSRRAAIPDPWQEVAKKYAIGTKITGKVARLQPFGAFIELEPGIDGLIHTADLSLKRIEHPNEVLKEGDSIDVVVVHLEIGTHKIGLHPAPTGAAADETPQRVIVNKPVKVAVVGYEATGLIVRILGATGRNARGFISAAATGTPRGTDLRREFPLNKQLEAKVTELDPRRGELKLSVKALSEDTERTAYRQYREQVTREAKFGTFADLLKKNVQK